MTLETLKTNIKWWESKRWIFNLLVGLVGIYGIYDGLQGINYKWTSADTIGVIVWGIGGNVFYSLGTLLEVYDWYYFKNRIQINNGLRFVLFIGGILFSCFWTLWNTVAYFKIGFY